MTDLSRLVNHKLYVEAIVVGISSVLTMILLLKLMKTRNNLCLIFLLGFSLHLIYEFLGLNRWYCSNFEL